MADKELFTEVASIARDITWPVYGGIIRPNDDTLIQRGGGKGLKIYDEIERDARAYSVLQKRKAAVISREWYVEAADESRAARKAADLVERQLKNANFDRACENLLDATLKGYAVGECMWRRDGSEIVLARIEPKEQRRFWFADDRSLRLKTWDNLLPGLPVPDRKFVVHSFGAKDGNPYGLGLGRALFWPVFFKRQDISFWLVYADKFAMPTPLGKYPPNAQPEEKAALLGTMAAIAHDSAVAIPDGMLIELLEAARAGGADSYEKLARYMDEQIAEIVLGETLTTNVGDVGSKAAASVHDGVRLELCKGDADKLSETLNDSVVRWIVDLNLPGAPYPKVYRQFAEEEDLGKRAERDTKLYGLGYEPTEDYIRETYGEGWVRRQGPSGPAAGTPLPVGTGPGDGLAFAAGDGPDLIDRYVDRADALAADAMEAIVAPVREMVRNAGSLEAIRDGLLDLYPKMDGKGLAELMAQATAAAHMAGRYEVSHGT
jgi:phage gp29-like protein